MKLIIAVALLALAASPVFAQEARFARKGNSWTAYLNGNNVVPNNGTGGPVRTAATAVLTVSLNERAQVATYSFLLSNIQGFARAHIHVGTTADNGPPVFLIFPALTGPNNITAVPSVPGTDICSFLTTGKITPDTVLNFNGNGFNWDQFVQALKDNRLYSDVHTVQNPVGEIRGQLLGSRFRYSLTCPKSYYRPWSLPVSAYAKASLEVSANP